MCSTKDVQPTIFIFGSVQFLVLGWVLVAASWLHVVAVMLLKTGFELWSTESEVQCYSARQFARVDPMTQYTMCVWLCEPCIMVSLNSCSVSARVLQRLHIGLCLI